MSGQPSRYSSLYPAHSGQGGLVAVAMTILASLLIVGLSISSMAVQNTRRNVANTQSLQIYYIAQAGIQEALASRMVPRNNELNFRNLPVPPNPQPYYVNSGFVFNDPATRLQRLGAYRYLILGGDPTVNPAAGNTFDVTRLDENIALQPFIVLSKATVCRDAGGGILTNALGVAANRPTCTTGTMEEMVAMATVDFSRTNPNYVNTDYVQRFQVFGNDNITLPVPAVVPNYGNNPVTAINFETAWNPTVSGAIPIRFAAHGMIAPKNERSQNITGNLTTINFGGANPNVRAKDTIRIFFSNDVDWRSIYGTNMNACKTNPMLCNIRIERESDGTVYNGATLIPNLPFSNQIIIFPPTSGNMTAGQWYRIIITPNLRDSKGDTIGTQYTIRFQVV